MSKYYGAIGFSEFVEKSPGVFIPQITEKNYRGDVTRNTFKYHAPTDQVNDNVNISNDFSIIADQYAFSNLSRIKYVTYMGAKWKINNVEVKFPRLILHVSDIYNGEEVEEDNG